MFLQLEILFLEIIIFNLIKTNAMHRCECGTPATVGLIVNGYVVNDMRKYPWLVSLHDVGPNDDGWGYCGGALISLDTVVTAAHCMYERKTGKCGEESCLRETENVQIGLLGPSKFYPRRKVRISSFITHPDFLMSDMYSDIAVLQLAQEVECTEYSRPICITDEELVGEGDVVRIAGFGRVGPQEKSLVLRDGSTTVVDGSECDMYDTDPETTLCTMGEYTYSCHGDSGTPSIVQKGGSYYIVGVTSGGEKDCPGGTPGIYTKISHFYPFIMDFMEYM